MGGIEASTREGNQLGETTNRQTPRESCRTFHANLGHNCRALHETSPPLEPVDATSADVFRPFGSNPRASIVPTIFASPSREIFSLSSPIVFSTRSNPFFFQTSHTHTHTSAASFIQKNGRRFAVEISCVRGGNSFRGRCMTCVSCNTINPALLNGVIN